MSDINQKVDVALESVLKAAGTKLQNYMPSTKDDMRKAMLQVMKNYYVAGSDAAIRAMRPE